MASPLNKKVHRLCNYKVQGRRVVVTLIPGTDSRHDIVAVRLHGKQTQYHVTISEIYVRGALNYANKMKAAKAEARKSGVPWMKAKKDFVRNNKL